MVYQQRHNGKRLLVGLTDVFIHGETFGIRRNAIVLRKDRVIQRRSALIHPMEIVPMGLQIWQEMFGNGAPIGLTKVGMKTELE